MKNIVSIFGGHDANVSFYNAATNEYHTIEIERLVQKRYFRLHVDNSPEYQEEVLRLCQDVAEEDWGIENDYEVVLISSDGFVQTDVRNIFNTQNVKTIARHHETHAAATFYQSPFEEALIISYDGGGDDGHFNVYAANNSGIVPLDVINADFGGGYLLCGSMIREVAEKSRHQLALAGKMMGLCAYGKVIPEYVDAFAEFFFDRNYKKLAETTGLPLKNLDNPWSNALDNWVFEGQEGYDIAATAQEGFEKAFFSVLEKYNPNVPVCLTGGAALNVLVNEKLKNEYNREVFVPPNPHDGGLSLGHIFLYSKPKGRVNITYNGLPLMDVERLPEYITEYKAKKTTKKEIAELIKQGNIIGLVYGDSEVGPRALGNRSIVCDPNIKEMKDILNSKVKFREWYRPFAPFCKKEDASKYFESRNFDNLEFMSYAPKVREEYLDLLPSITHADNTARLQVVTEESHSHFYELLTEFGKISETNVLLNTSFNTRGYPILSSIKDALYNLEETKMDYVVIEDYLFRSKNAN
jgi:carbamoyltransferase